MITKVLRLIFATFFLFQAHAGFTQFFPQKIYPKGYFTYPVVATRSLSANFGELRSNHYHMGLDCRTNQVQNKRVLAAAEGYIAKVKVEPWGYGRAIYINHPNGLTTVYGHLNDFYPELENYVKEEQYKLKTWKVYLDVPAHLFPVTRGMFIAFSGNSGGSMGPHLHFEIRDTKTDKVLNPLLFDFGITDNIAPDIFKLAVYDRCLSTYEQTPKIYNLRKVGGVYEPVPALILANTDKVSFGITASDRYTGSANRNGIYEAVLFDNEQPVAGFQLDSIGYDETRYLNAHIDYTYRSSGRSYIQHLSKLPGYPAGVYKTTAGDGVINIDDEQQRSIKIEVKDADGNTSLVRFNLKQNAKFTEAGRADPSNDGQETWFHPGFINTFENSNLSFYLPENALYDSIRFQYKEVNSNTGFTIHQLHHTGVPVHSYFPVSIKASTPLPDKMIMHRFANGKDDYARAEPVNQGRDTGWYRASFREFGSFQLMIDTEPPVITPVGFKDGMDCSKQRRIVFVITDNAEDLQNFTATLDGNWLMFSNDKGRRFIYEFDEHCGPGEHELKLTATDLVGNVTEKTYRFTR